MLPLLSAAAKKSVIARVEQKFSSGEQNYKAGHLERRGKISTKAVDCDAGSGYDLNADGQTQ